MGNVKRMGGFLGRIDFFKSDADYWNGVVILKGLTRGIGLGVILILLSTLLYELHYSIYHEARDIFYWMLMNVAYLPIELLLVTLIIHRWFDEREKKARLEKLNMVIGAFFSEVGTELLAYFSDRDPRLNQIREELIPNGNWTEKEFAKVSARLQKYDYSVQSEAVDLERLREFLIKKRDFLLHLLGNPNMLEHESFTDLFWAVFHLTEELSHRQDMRCLPGSDCQHLSIDIQRAYSLLAYEWLNYMKHLKSNYPHLFSLAMRMNPFDRNASLVIQ